jgi:hypothetical protein
MRYDEHHGNDQCGMIYDSIYATIFYGFPNYILFTISCRDGVFMMVYRLYIFRML